MYKESKILAIGIMKIFKDKYLLAGFIVRVICIPLAPSGFVNDFYYPFFGSITSFSLDPWSSWVENGGRQDAFPYGLVLFIVLYCVFLIDLLVTNLFHQASSIICFTILLLLVDLYVYKVLLKRANKNAALLYISSPVVIYISFITLQSDSIVGLFLLLFSLSLLSRRRRSAGLFLGMAIGSKFGIVLIVPFILVFAAVNKRFQRVALETLVYSVPISIASYIPVVWSNGFKSMVFESDRATEIYSLSIRIDSFEFLVFPATYLLLMLWIWRSGHSNIRVLVGFIGVSFFLLSVMSMEFVGWHLWGLASLLIVILNQEIHLKVVFYILQFLVVLRYTLGTTTFDIQAEISKSVLTSLVFTSLLILTSVWSLSTLRKLLANADLLILNKKPLLVSIAGDSGVGKDTLANAMSEIFGKKNTTVISGDSFHKFERDHNSWKAKTHLDPRQNNLTNWDKAIALALTRNRFQTRNYEHSIGKFTGLSPHRLGDLIISQGLHALSGKLAQSSDLKIYMEMPEKQRIQFKVARDVSYRRQEKKKISNQIKARKSDFHKFIYPQKRTADLIVEQISGSQRNPEISKVKITFSDQDMAVRVYDLLLPITQFMDLKELRSDKIILNLRAVDKISRLELSHVLQNSLSTYEELNINSSEIPPGSTGIIACISFICIEFVRQVKNQASNL
jgi:uridine kinase